MEVILLQINSYLCVHPIIPIQPIKRELKDKQYKNNDNEEQNDKAFEVILHKQEQKENEKDK